MGGNNKYGQLGTGTKTLNKISTEFTCIDALLDLNVSKIFAGAGQSFAVVDTTNEPLDVFLKDYDEINDEWSSFETTSHRKIS